jgi:uncharacterized coiled-coil protein SlyX
VADVQERVAQLEGRVEGHAQMLTDVAGAVRHLEARMDQRFASVDLRFTEIENRLNGLEGRLTALDQKLDRKTDALAEKLEREVGRLDQKLDSHFRWLVGIQFAMLIALVASFIAG